MNRLRRFLLLLPALVAAAGCSAEKNLSIVVSAARAPGTNCDFSDPTKYVEGGAVDMSVFGGASTYFQVFSWESQLQQISTTVNGDQISGAQANTFISTYVQLSYILVGGSNPPTGIINMSASITAGATPDKNSVGVELLTPQAATAGYNAALANPGASQTLLVTFAIFGNLVGGGSSQTNPVTFPLTLFYGIPPVAGTLTCPANTTSQMTSCGIPGRDIQYCVP
ncbi:MAG TPA: hypothetical protein VEJ89_08230 [Myxococcaceae bacterium]|nr:hypothetical protein [Myxococcaceae bacterium]